MSEEQMSKWAIILSSINIAYCIGYFIYKFSR